MNDSADRKDDDAALVARSLNGDRDAFGCLYDRSAGLVRAMTYDAFTDYGAAQDLTQEVFLRAYRKLGSLRRAERFGSWVLGIARQVCREKRRSLRRDRHQFVGSHLAERAVNPPVAERLQSAEERELILRQVAELPERERLAIRSFYLNGRGVEETARLLGVSRSSVYALLQRGCERVAKRLLHRQSKTEED